MRFVNVLRRPVPAANFAAAAALADGAEYLYSVDDDTELETPWAARCAGPGLYGSRVGQCCGCRLSYGSYAGQGVLYRL